MLRWATMNVFIKFFNVFKIIFFSNVLQSMVDAIHATAL